MVTTIELATGCCVAVSSGVITVSGFYILGLFVLEEHNIATLKSLKWPEFEWSFSWWMRVVCSAMTLK